ncbi:MAG TPA: sugar ABC transporter substrate-binding protein [Conexibacter sp.]|jgi:ABC-type sugar transport system substrate-binding protein|nr:sugar ABC transporter substrate-binding protein [Conexibacter sp.]
MRSTPSRTLASFAACALALVVGLAGCGSSGDGGGGGKDASKVRASLIGRQVPFFADLGSGLAAQAKGDRLDFSTVYAQFNPQDQLSSVENLIAQQPGGLLVAPLDKRSLAPVLRSAQSDGIKVVTVADSLDDPSASSAYVGADFAEIGTRKAQAIVAALKGKGEVAFLNGPRGTSFVEEQRAAAQKVFDAAPGIKVVADDFAPLINKDAGLRATENVLTAHPNVAALFYSGDDAALGGVQALQERKIPLDKVFVAGTDGLAAGVAGVHAGQIDFTVSQCPYEVGRIAVRTLQQLLGGEKVPSVVTTPMIDLTPATIDKTLSSNEWAACAGSKR